MLTQKPFVLSSASLDSCTDAPTCRRRESPRKFRHPAGKDLKKLDKEKIYTNLHSSRSFEKTIRVGPKRRSALMKSLLRGVPWRTRRDVLRVLREVFRHLSQTGPSRRSAAPNPIPHTSLSERRIRVLRSPPCRLPSTKKDRRQDLSPPEVLGGGGGSSYPDGSPERGAALSSSGRRLFSVH